MPFADRLDPRFDPRSSTINSLTAARKRLIVALDVPDTAAPLPLWTGWKTPANGSK